MLQNLDDFDLNVISVILEGSFPAFPILRRQIGLLKVTDRTCTPNRYTVNFELQHNSIELVEGSSANMEVLDTRIYVNDPRALLYAKLIVLSGYIRTLIVGSYSEFDRSSPLGQHFWCSSFEKEISEDERCYEARERDFTSAIGYYPAYK